MGGAAPCLPLHLRLPVTVARPAEAGAEQDGEPHAQDAQEDAEGEEEVEDDEEADRSPLALTSGALIQQLYHGGGHRGCGFTVLIQIAAPLANSHG